jgi:hypothetical protein
LIAPTAVTVHSVVLDPVQAGVLVDGVLNAA